MSDFIAELPLARRGNGGGGGLPYLLINPPLSDPSQPYHSIPYLVGAARAAGFTGERCVDANIDALNYLAHPEQVGALLSRAGETTKRVESLTDLTRQDELDYRAALAAETLTADSVRAAVEVFKSGELFYHHPTYRQAVLVMKTWQELLGLDGIPKSITNFAILPGGVVNLCAYQDLCDPAVIDRITRPFDPYLYGPFAEILRERPWRVAGFSVSFLGQLPAALRMARMTREANPEAVIVFGGTEVCDDVRLAQDPGSYWRLFKDADIIVPGEGESPFCDVLQAATDGRSFGGIRGILTRDENRPHTPINYENVGALPGPAYDVWEWGSYWTPEPVVLYSPTRGCYWNKCTFCDYGLNTDRPTAPSRERPVEKVIEDLESIARIGRTIYFSVDAMSPKYLRLLSAALRESGSSIRWGAELRLERTFPQRDMARHLREAGCVAISFGYESGSQRVLDLIDKGVRVDEVPSILTHLKENNIGAQMMGFTGFPTERPAEAEQTYDFLLDHSDLWTLAGITQFTLTPGSIIAKRPAAFNIEVLPIPASQDIKRYLPWRELPDGVPKWPGEAGNPNGDEWKLDLLRRFDGRPYVGGIDTAHTLLYFARFGPELVPEDSAGEPRIQLTRIVQREIPFRNIEDFADWAAVRDQYLMLQRNGGSTCAAMGTWLADAGKAERGRVQAVITPPGRAIALGVDESRIPPGRLQELLALAARMSGDA